MKNIALVSSLCALAFTACPMLDPTPLEAAPRITSFTSTAGLVDEGQTVTLAWNVEGATQLTLEEATLGQVSGVDGTGPGQLEVAIAQNSLFVLTVRNARGASARAVVAVNLRARSGELQLTAVPSEIDRGESVALAWSAPGATSVTLSSPAGAVPLNGQLESGVVTVTPDVSARYTLTADSTRTATVDVTVRPTLLSFTADTDAVDVVNDGARIELRWETANATRVQLLAPGRTALVDAMDAATVTSGSFVDVHTGPIDPSQLFRYDLVMTGPGRSVTRSITLPVRGRPAIVTFDAPRFTRSGAQVSVAWTTTGAQEFRLLQDGLEVYRSPNAQLAAAGSATLIAGNADLELTAVATTTTGGSVQRSTTVELVGLPQLTLGHTPATVAMGDPFELTWTGQNVRELTVYGPDSRVLTRLIDLADTGTVPITLRLGGSGTWRAVASNGLGDLASAQTSINVTSPFTFTPSLTGSVPYGERVTLTWPGTETVYGFPHDEVTVRPGSTGFDDISVTGTALTFTNEGARIVTPFRAPLWGQLLGEVITVTDNGFVTFGPANTLNSTEVPFPNAKIDPYTLALNWNSLSGGSVRWQVKTVGSDEVLIVQWTGVSSFTGQIKVWSTGQVDFEYQTMPTTFGTAGVQGPRGDEGLGITTPTAGTGVTFFAPKTASLSFSARSRQPYGGFLRVGGEWVPVNTSITVVRTEELQLSEALIAPNAAVGANGRWLEFTNTTASPIDLTGWTFRLRDGGVGDFPGIVPAHGTRVFGVSTDRALNDDAGVDVALVGFDVNENLDNFSWGRGASAFGSLAWNNPTTGVAAVRDMGPFRFSTDVAGNASRPQTCVASRTFGGQTPQQRGTPGRDETCGFGYGVQQIAPGYFDVSAVGQKWLGQTTTSTLLSIDLSSAPVPFYGQQRNTVRFSADGYLTFDLTATNNLFTSEFPSTAGPNSALAIFADDLAGRRPEAGLYTYRAEAGVDPFASAPHWIFQWHRWARSDAEDDLNFEVKLFDDGTIEYHFGVMAAGPESTAYVNGSSAITWLENPAGTQALVLNANTPGISPFTAFRFTPR